MSSPPVSDKLSKLQSTSRLGGKGTPRRKVKKAPKTGTSSSTVSLENDKKIANALKKINAQFIPGIEEVNLFKEDGKIIHIAKPSVQASVQCSTFCVTGHAEEKPLVEMVPGILNQLGADSIANLRRIAESFQAKAGIPKVDGQEDNDDDDVPELVDNFNAQVSV